MKRKGWKVEYVGLSLNDIAHGGEDAHKS
jgi:hypothetical protein